MFKKFRIYLLAAVLLLALGCAYILLYPAASSARTANRIEIPTGSQYGDVRTILSGQGFVAALPLFDLIAKASGYASGKIHPGSYEVAPSVSLFGILKVLRSGRQTPVQVVFHNERMISDLAGRLGVLLEPDSLAWLTYFADSANSAALGLKPPTLMTLMIPNTYEMYWNSSPQNFLERMQKEHKRFWEQQGRQQKAAALGMSPAEVYTLASIVEKESNYKDERPAIAGLYLNRLKIGMRLQADPTVVYANQDFGIQRVYSGHLSKDSPYNTYLYTGLPPGPICVPSINAIDAVLNRDSHNYTYMCARPDESGRHVFAETLQAHAVNANKYRKFLQDKGIL